MVKTQVQELEQNKVALIIEVGKEKVSEAFTNFFHRAAMSVSIPGFRRGKIPRPVLTRFLGPDAIKAQIEDELVHDAYPLAVKETNIHPVSEYTLEESSLKEGEPFTFKAVVEIKPKLGEFTYNGHSVKAAKTIVDDESMRKVFDRLTQQFSKSIPVEDGELEYGDYFLANIQAKCDGVEDKDISEEKGYHKFEENQRMFAAMKGMKPKESRSFSHFVDQDSEKDSKYYKKTIDLTVTLESISRPVVPQLNDDFAKEIGDYKNMDELKAKIQKDLEDHSQNEAEAKAYDLVIDEISKGISVNIPEAMIQRMIEFFVQNMDRRWRQYGATLEEYLKKSNKQMSEFREGFRAQAEQQTKVMLIVDAIAEREKIQVSDGEYRSEVEKRAKEYNISVDKLLANLAEGDGEGEENIKFYLRSRKIREFLLKNNQIHYDMVKEADINKGETEGDSCTNSN